MADLFASAKSTLRHAHRHIENFNTLVDEFVKGNPWTYIVDRDSKPGYDIHKIKFTEQSPEILPCILFDIANNLRAVLDQAGYAAAIAHGKIKPKRTQFPFGDDPGGLNRVIDRGRCKDLPPEILALFRGFSPYKGGNDPLWALNKVCNTKKHCALIPLHINKATAFFSGDIIGDRWFIQTVSPTSTGLGWIPKKNEMTLMITPAATESDIKASVGFTIAIHGIESLEGKPAVSVLRAMASEVERVLMATEAECRRPRLI